MQDFNHISNEKHLALQMINPDDYQLNKIRQDILFSTLIFYIRYIIKEIKITVFS